MVIEGILTTENLDGSMHVAPIGPHVDSELTCWILKPFQSSTTFANLRVSSRAVFHIVDDALLMACAVLGMCNPVGGAQNPSSLLGVDLFQELTSAEHDAAAGWELSLSCRTIALSVTQWDVTEPRAIATCVATKVQQVRPFWGWNRAKHSILELAIVASRVHMLARQEIDEQLARHKIIIEKTAGARELAAWELLRTQLSQ